MSSLAHWTQGIKCVEFYWCTAMHVFITLRFSLKYDNFRAITNASWWNKLGNISNHLKIKIIFIWLEKNFMYADHTAFKTCVIQSYRFIVTSASIVNKDGLNILTKCISCDCVNCEWQSPTPAVLSKMGDLLGCKPGNFRGGTAFKCGWFQDLKWAMPINPCAPLYPASLSPPSAWSPLCWAVLCLKPPACVLWPDHPGEGVSAQSPSEVLWLDWLPQVSISEPIGMQCYGMVWLAKSQSNACLSLG
jgi:hypothetical protein